MTTTLPAAERKRATAQGTARVFRPVSFAVTLAFSIGILVLLAVASVLAIQWWASEKNTFTLLNEQTELIIERIASGVQSHLQPAAEVTSFLADKIESGAVSLDDRDRLVELLTGSLAAAPQLAAVIHIDPAFQGLGVGRPAEGVTAVIAEDYSDDPDVRAAIADLAQSKQAFWGEPVTREDGISLINRRQPLHRDGRFIGALVTAITVPELSEIVTEVGDLFGATAFILYGEDRVLAHPNLVATRSGAADDAAATVPLNHIGDIVLGDIWQAVAAPGFEQAAAHHIEVRGLQIGDEAYAVIYTWLDEFGAVPWVLGAWFPMADVSKELERLWYAGFAGIGVLVLAIVAAVVLGRLIARPLRRVAANAARVGALDLEHVEALPSSRIRELNDQAGAFNAMLSGLRSFETYVPRSLVTRLIKNDADSIVDSGERELTVMFTDIAGFTAMAEQMPAADVAAFLNGHFALLGACVEAEGGTVDKFIGDALMAFWGAPDPLDDTASPATRTALAITSAIDADNAARRTRGLPPIRMRIGIHTGSVVVGNVGWPGRINYTIVGDAVNTCQRLESMGKEMDRGDAVTVLISGATADRLAGFFALDDAGSVQVKGRSEAVRVFRLTTPSEPQ